MNAEHSRELPVPKEVQYSQEAIELVRAWAVDGKQYVALTAEVWDDPAAWGMLLVDLARHAALAYGETEGREPVDVLKRIREGFDAEWDYPTDLPSQVS